MTADVQLIIVEEITVHGYGSSSYFAAAAAMVLVAMAASAMIADASSGSC